MSSVAIKAIIPRLPSRDLQATRNFYVDQLKFTKVGADYPEYLMVARDGMELHFFLFKELNPLESYGMCYLRVVNIDGLYEEFRKQISNLKSPDIKPWGQKEMYVHDPDNNVLAIGEAVNF